MLTLICLAGATDVLAAIQQNAPADYFAPDQLPPSKKRFEPRGELLGRFPVYLSLCLFRPRSSHCVAAATHCSAPEAHRPPGVLGMALVPREEKCCAIMLCPTACAW